MFLSGRFMGVVSVTTTGSGAFSQGFNLKINPPPKATTIPVKTTKWSLCESSLLFTRLGAGFF
jgi:hypothetical protein